MRKQVVRRSLQGSPEVFASDLHPVLARVYAARNVPSRAALNYSLSRLHPFTTLSGVEEAVDLLVDALAFQRRILIVADFDADGATACAVAIRGLRLMGAQDVHYLVPNRFAYGYGLTPEIVAVAAHQGPDLLITVDNGISSVEGIRAAKSHGMRVLVTDHHLAGEVLPEADAIVNPNQPGDAFPSKNLAGVGVIFYVLLALRTRLRERGWFQGPHMPEPNLAQLLDLVALGTVADVVPLDENNRILVAQGLARIRHGRGQVGVRALLRVAGRDAGRVVAADLAFGLGPRLNAAGRLTDMSLGIECLLIDDESQAMMMAARLDELNRERRTIESQMQAQAEERLGEMQLDERTDLPLGLCLFDEQWHQGVIGILASRIKDRMHRPVIAFAVHDGDVIKGSARSIPGLHIRDALDAVATRHPGLLAKFGGHAMAAGLSLRRGDLEVFQAAFDAEVRRHLSADALHGKVYSDGALRAEDLDLELAEALRAAGPWGQGFPEPVFDGEFELVRRRVVGDRHLKLALGVPGSRKQIDAIAFNNLDEGWANDTRRAFIAYRLDVNVYRGVKSPQLVIEHIEPI